MNTIKNHRFFKAICFALIVTFLTLDISYAYPAEYIARNSTVAAPSVFQEHPVTQYAEEFQRSVIEDGNLLGTVYSIGEALLEDGLKLSYLAGVIYEELGDANRYVNPSNVRVIIMGDGVLEELDPSLLLDTPRSAVVLIPYDKDGKKGIIELALKDNPLIDRLPGYKWAVSDKYLTKELPEDYKAPVLRPASEVKAEAPIRPTVSEPVAQVEALLTKSEKAKGITSKSLSIRAVILSSLLMMLFPLSAFAGTGDAVGAGLVSTYPIVIAVPVILSGIALVLSIWRRYHPVSWYFFWTASFTNSGVSMERLIKMGGPAVPYLVQKALKTGRGDVRWFAIYILERIYSESPEIILESPEVVPALVKAIGDEEWIVRHRAARFLRKVNDERLSFMGGYLETVDKAFDRYDGYYEILKKEEIDYIIGCIDTNSSVESRYISYVPNVSIAQLIINMNPSAVPPVEGPGQGFGAAELQAKWAEKMKSAKEIGIQVNIDQLNEIAATKKEANGIEYFESKIHEMRVNDNNRWHKEGTIACSFDEAEFNFTKLYKDMKPQHVICETKMENDDWYISMNNMPIFKYHMIVAPKQARQQLATPKDLVDMQQLLAQMGNEKATLLHNSLLAGAGINSLHYHLFFYDFPIFKEGFPIYRGTEKFSTKSFTGKNCAQEAGSYLEELQGANQPYNLIMRHGRIIIMPRPVDTKFGYGADALAGVVFYGNDRSLEEATWYRSEPPQISSAAQLFEMVESSLNNRRARFIEAGNSLVGLIVDKKPSRIAANIGNLDQKMATAEIMRKIKLATVLANGMKRSVDMSEAEGLVEALESNSKQFEADALIGSLIVLARKAKREDQKLIIGLETDWIPAMDKTHSLQKQAISALMNEIKDMGNKLKSMGLDNVEIVCGSGKELAGALREKADKTLTRLHNIVVIASSATINSDNFAASLRSTDENDRPFLAGIDPVKLVEDYEKFGEITGNQLHIRLTQLLYMTLELASGKEPPGHIPMIDSYRYDKNTRTIIFVPRAEPMDYEVLKNTYAAEKTALVAA